MTALFCGSYVGSEYTLIFAATSTDEVNGVKSYPDSKNLSVIGIKDRAPQVCYGESILLETYAPGFSCTWSNGIISDVITVNPTETTKYVVEMDGTSFTGTLDEIKAQMTAIKAPEDKTTPGTQTDPAATTDGPLTDEQAHDIAMKDPRVAQTAEQLEGLRLEYERLKNLQSNRFKNPFSR